MTTMMIIKKYEDKTKKKILIQKTNKTLCRGDQNVIK